MIEEMGGGGLTFLHTKIWQPTYWHSRDHTLFIILWWFSPSPLPMDINNIQCLMKMTFCNQGHDMKAESYSSIVHRWLAISWTVDVRLLCVGYVEIRLVCMVYVSSAPVSTPEPPIWYQWWNQPQGFDVQACHRWGRLLAHEELHTLFLNN